MSFKKLLIANRGEIAIRIARAAADSGIATVAIHPADDAMSLHVRVADEAVEIPGRGARAYLDIEAVVKAAKSAGCDAVHPGYGFLSENAAFAKACADAGIAFVGPRAAALELFGDKVAARQLAKRCGVPIIAGTSGPSSLEDIAAFFTSLGSNAAIVIKAMAGGGGRGMRVVERAADLAEAYARCQSEAKAAFGFDGVYAERLIRQARHIEVQIIGDRDGAISHLWERECTIQRRHQKLIEVAPSPSLSDGLRGRIIAAAKQLAVAASYDNLGTFEFLVDGAAEDSFAFIEANPRLQVEHTVTEEVLGLDLVRAQLAVAAGASLASLGLAQGSIPKPRGYAMQLRVNMETLDELGATHPTGGVLAVFEPPSGPGVRVDSFGYAGYKTSAAFDSLLAKVIVHTPGEAWHDVVAKASRALREFRIDGVITNIAFLQAVLAHPDFRSNRIATDFIDCNMGKLVEAADGAAKPLYFAATERNGGPGTEAHTAQTVPEGTVMVAAPLQGTIVTIQVKEGEVVRPGQQLAVIESMKMEHLVMAEQGGRVTKLLAGDGITLMHGEPIMYLEPLDVAADASATETDVDLDHIRPDLAELIARQANTLDENRPASVERRRNTNQRTARENVAQLVDDDSFMEYGSLAIAAQRRRRKLDDLVKNTPADGLVMGVATVNAEKFGPEGGRCIVVAYDYTVLAGTQGHMNHKKIDRMLTLAEDWRVPLVFYAEGGGGRPGDTDRLGMTGLDGPSFVQFARLSGLVPVIGIVSGYCFAGNAAMLGCCDVIIATKNASIGMGGPAMIEGGGLGVYHPAEVGPVTFQSPNGVIDILVEDEEEATSVAQKYLSYFQGAVTDWQAADQRLLRRAIPENRLRVYDIRSVIDLVADKESVLELRRDYGVGMITALIRVEGKPFGLIANNPRHLGGAIDADAGDKAARFLQLCDAFDLPIVSLCDTPGFMVGPEAEKTAIVRHVSRMFVTGASLTVPLFGIVLRKGYGLGAQSMIGGGFHASFFTAAWPTGEFGGMGLEGYVRLGFRKEMEAIADPVERETYYRNKVAELYANGKAVSIASVFEIDNVIDPAETRRWIMAGLRSVPKPPARTGKKRPCIDTW
ncbi:acetyl/propionyl-CoA carboxylase alpha subunit/acetyl-CoA carboxylase carboxyltransferase component [Bradyrhizobium sp. GM2.2]|jgi:acetyl/propionyl-CoA carboxylase alpha subunit/acetyl-CoA carboxylase carboxyltransferase component|uniref:acetyl-CoA carboxylase family protein n=1 Tax=unclassified Bradyrhizobium TaxID=2631580 RepID=UPI001FFA24E3|nr:MULTISPECIES: carboxyl transferase domain-containing protein [unclassified Bradyrhizobium]MCK1267729.1 biotin/lipoyl-binding protein [Bradyrhizobium sp. 84]MCK1290444.1 biotin/lipoyl-binding protein [Bradyrhizobium sp. 30]MCK1308658.1 biotin/lipoyl-binding protein [Bradyrhizobium sp. 45]MCK1312975.1 biotin/lipoyl-binding protein [Bradyrhizobium sp. 23]MCK1320489.1 biotin/lipoyl-binding protein [Bradyrhizobium sp. 156]